MKRLASMALLVVACLTSPGLARGAFHTPPSTLTLADAAWARGDRSDARRLYAAVFARQPRLSRVVFRLAQLANSREQALLLYHRYTALEPDDPWGYMAAGDVLSRLGRTREALEEYDQAARLAPAERDVSVGRARALNRAGRREEAAGVLQSWLSDHPDDAAVQNDLGRTWLGAGKPRRAAQALERVLDSGPDPVAESRLRLARSLDGPAIEPRATSGWDSDGNRVFGTGTAADVAVGDGVRLGVSAMRTRVEDDGSRGVANEAKLRLTLRPSSTWRIEAAAGGASLDPRDGTAPARPRLGEARARWRAPGGTPAVDMRAMRIPVTTTPLLLAHHTMRNEGRFGFEVPVRAVRLRGTLRGASIESASGTNGFTAADGAVALPMNPSVAPWVLYRLSGYRAPTDAGYFAPRRAETVEMGSSIEVGDGSPWLLELDLGAGFQRHAAHGRPLGPWGPALDSYGTLSYAAGRGREVRLEAESGESSQLTTSTSPSWKYGSLSLSLRWPVI